MSSIPDLSHVEIPVRDWEKRRVEPQSRRIHFFFTKKSIGNDAAGDRI